MSETLGSPFVKALFVAVVVLGLVLRIYFLIATPYHTHEEAGKLSAYNDEPAHVAYTVHILETGKLPGTALPITTSLRSARPSFENYQSPLYYMIHSGMCRTFGVTSENGVMYVGRVLSLLCMIGIAWTMFSIARIAKLSLFQKVFALSFLSLSGVFIRFSTQSGNEAMAWLFSGLVCLAFLRFIDRIHHRPLFALILIFAAGIYTKLSILLLAPLVLLALFLSFRSIPRSAAFAAIVMLVMITPLFIYNSSVFGSPIPLAAGFGEPSWRIPNLETGTYFLRSLVFPWSEVWQSWLGLLMLLPAILITSWFLLKSLLLRTQHHWTQLLVGTALIAYAALNVRYDQAEARYLFIAWPALIPVVSTFPLSLRRISMTIIFLILPYLLFVI